jgi:DinB superfamily
MIDLEAYIRRFDAFGRTVRTLVEPLTNDEVRFKPDPGTWSVLEIVCHLGDEEVLDFRTRARLTLEDPAAAWPPIDPERWAIDRKYNERDPREALAFFETERAVSIAWLRSLASPDWSRTHQHPTIGPMAAGDVLVSWAAHDALHLAQIARRLQDLAEQGAPDFSTRYATG